MNRLCYSSRARTLVDLELEAEFLHGDLSATRRRKLKEKKAAR
jgi:hypothetical protein